MEAFRFYRLARPSAFICSSCRSRARLHIGRAFATSSKYERNEDYKTKRKPKKPASSEVQFIPSSRVDFTPYGQSTLRCLEERGFVNQIVGERDDFDQLLQQKRVGAYVGIDPTASSMHVGHLVPLMALYWMFLYGHDTTTLLGAATAIVGDPTGRTEARAKQEAAERASNRKMIRKQLERLWGNFDSMFGKSPAWRGRTKAEQKLEKEKLAHRLISNMDWFEELPLIEVLRVVGPGMKIGTMLARDSVTQRLDKGGMSLSEFCYPMMQAWDWWHLYQIQDIQIQIGGSDQFGNILAGMDAVNYVRRNHQDLNFRDSGEQLKSLHRKPMGFTVPLLTDSTGQKFGKSAGNAISLDRELTTPFDLYQFFLRTADADVFRYLKLFTFESLANLESLMEQHNKDPPKRLAQHKLAKEVLKLVHGLDEADIAEREHQLLFGAKASTSRDSPGENALSELLPLDPAALPDPIQYLPPVNIATIPLFRLLSGTYLAQSGKAATALIKGGGCYIGTKGTPASAESSSAPKSSDGTGFTFVRCNDPKMLISEEQHLINGNRLVFRLGKTKVRVIGVELGKETETEKK